MPARITVCYTNQPAVESFLYEESDYRIGRSKECELILEHPTVSRQHATVANLNRVWQLNDESSRNGTRVNGLAISTSTLEDDAIISIGKLDCLFESKSTQQIQAIQSHNNWRLSASKPGIKNITVNLKQNLLSQLQNLIMLTGTQRGGVFLGNTLQSLRVCITQGLSGKDFKLNNFEGSIGAISQCYSKGEPIIAMDITHHQLLSSRQSIELKKISALACIPLTYEGSIIGVIYTDSKMSGKVLTELDLEILTSISLQIETTVQAILLQQSIELLQSQLINSSSFDGNDYNLFKLCH